jgi:hypothetical protein
VPETDTTDLSEKVLLEWEAYERPHKVWSKEFYSSIVVIAFLVSVILYFIEGAMPVVVVWALVFMMWAMGRTEPRKIKTTITSWGLRATEKIYRFEEMSAFWFETKWGSRLLRINLVGAPWHIVTVIDPGKEEEIKNLMLKKVIYQEPAVTWSDRAVKWMGEKIPLE